MKNNQELQTDVQNAIKWQPLLHAAEIGVTVHDGIVTLTGTVDNYSKKLQAENAAKNVVGVKAVVEKMEVHHHNSWDKKNDNDIADEILKAYKWNWQIPNDKLHVKVENGWVILTGELNWNYQKEEAANTIKSLEGIVNVTNNITIKSETVNAMEKEVIEHHLRRNWALNADDINVQVNGTKVTLSGTVGSLYQKEEAGRITWNTPGIWSLENNLNVHNKYINIF
ncbi:MAG: BON domain-containing protein [Chitinophagaceae bacterium]